ncbi:MAG: hypothetical protein HRF50_16075 [Phycisphaerae bacterium]|jgi:hypothetical protein
MAQSTAAIEAPRLTLKHCSVEEHCLALCDARRLPYWFHTGTSRVFGNFSLPVRDADGRWWFSPRPGLAWLVDCYAAVGRGGARPPLSGSFLAYQHVVPDAEQANSQLVINTVVDVPSYGPASVPLKRRNGIRKSLKNCVVERLAGRDAEALEHCRQAWNDLTQRTGWRHTAERAEFHNTFTRMMELPGVSVIVGRDRESGQVAGFNMVKVIGDTAYVDTIASRTDMLKLRVNEALMYTFVANAALVPGVQKAHYAIKSYVAALEDFKQGVGFVPTPFPAYTRFRGPTGLLLRTLFKDKYRRMMGQFDTAPTPAETAGGPAEPESASG